MTGGRGAGQWDACGWFRWSSRRPLSSPIITVDGAKVTYGELSVARDRLVFNLGERTGAIWLARPPEQR
jgi:hypothetical protein